MKPLVSIITITYQAEAVLERTMESVLSQTFQSYEYLIIDGHSTDKTLTILQEYKPKFLNKGISFKWISESDRGIYDAMNKALHLAEGEYIWFMNAGDKIPTPDTLALIWQSDPDLLSKDSQETLPDFIYGETLIVDHTGKIMGERRLKAPETLTWKSFEMGMLVCHQAMLVKRRIAPDYDLQYHYSGDFDWAIRCLQRAQKIYNTHLILAHFLDGGVSKKKMKASLRERFHIMSKNYGWMPTAARHLWFVYRAAWFKLFHGWI
jgi:glycosyltransferase involved in cell wall biosynthesis